MSHVTFSALIIIFLIGSGCKSTNPATSQVKDNESTISEEENISQNYLHDLVKSVPSAAPSFECRSTDEGVRPETGLKLYRRMDRQKNEIVFIIGLEKFGVNRNYWLAKWTEGSAESLDETPPQFKMDVSTKHAHTDAPWSSNGVFEVRHAGFFSFEVTLQIDGKNLFPPSDDADNLMSCSKQN